MKKVIIIDDEPDIGFILSFELKHLGYQTLTFEEPDKAIAYIASQGADAVICDFQMPKMDGLMVFGEIKKLGLSIPFFILTGEPAMDTKLILNQGVTDVLFKPQDLTQIKSIFERHLG